ncbi:MAG: hypothetical protein ACI4LM_04160 [Anaerovoracaceae bacterium]
MFFGKGIKMTEDEKRKAGIVVIAAAAVVGAVTCAAACYEKKSEERLRDRIKRRIDSVDLREYGREEREKVAKVVNKYAAKLKDATDKFDLYAVWDAFEEAMSDIKTSAVEKAEEAKSKIAKEK